MRTRTIVLSLLLLISPAFAEDVELQWDPYSGTIDGFDIEHTQDLSDPVSWTIVNVILLTPTTTQFTHTNVDPGIHFWRVVAVSGSIRTNTEKGAWKRIPLASPGGLSTP